MRKTIVFFAELTITRGCVKTPNMKILNSLCVHLWMRNEFFIFL